MNIDYFCEFLLWSLAINYAIFFIWFGFIVFAHGWIRQLHGKWFDLSDSAFDAIHYGGMAVYKIGILLFNVAPLAALWLTGSASQGHISG